jgi:SH3 domain-containing YSC84-like protein 1
MFLTYLTSHIKENKMSIKKILAIFCFLMVSLPVSGALADDYSDTQALVDKSTVLYKSFITDPNMTWFQNNVQRAKAVFIVPQMLKAGFFLGGSGGSGTLLSRDLKTNVWSYPVFYTMGSVSLGLQFGGEASQIILMVMTDKGMDSMLTTSFKLGADASVAAGPVGQGAKAATADILAFAQSKGAFIGIAIEGAIIKPRDKWNAAYYKQQVSPADIIIRNAASNPGAEKLRQAVSK